MFTDWRRERFIRKTLRAFARQRVTLLLQGNIWFVEHAVTDDDQSGAALRTCHIRGWVEVAYDSVRTGQLTAEGGLPPPPYYSGTKPIYRLTEAGWAELRRTHEWLVATFAVSLIGMAASVAAYIIALR